MMGKRKKGLFIILMVLFLLFLTLFTGYAQDKSFEMEPQKWSFMLHRSNLSSFDDFQQQEAFNRIKEHTNGLLDIITVFTGSLPIKSEEWLRAVAKGDIEMCVVLGDYHAGDFPLLGLLQTPFLFRSQVEINMAVVASWPILQREANKLGIQLLVYRPYGEVGFWTTEPIKNITNVEGRKLRAQAKVFADMTKAMGGVPVNVEWGETYTALQRGLVKGIFTGYGSFSSAKLQEVAPYAHRIFLSNQFSFIAVNKKLWGNLPTEVQMIVLEELGRTMVLNQARVSMVIDEEIVKQKAGGLKSYEPNPPIGWFELLEEKVAKPTLEAELKKTGDIGQELINAIEIGIGRKIH